MFAYWILLPLHFGWLLVLGLYKEDYLQILNVCPFDNTAFVVSGKVGIPVNRYNYTSWLAVTPTERLKSAHNGCVIEHFVCVFTLLYWLSVGKGDFGKALSQIFPFSLNNAKTSWIQEGWRNNPQFRFYTILRR